ncbi:MAG: HAD family hydrolase [bacterium]|nr:HAD family hydrolase [bacterium]
MSKITTELPRRGDLDALFLDAGNTLMSMDFSWISGELAKLGHPVPGERIARNEARIRPSISKQLLEDTSTESRDFFHQYLTLILEPLIAVTGEQAREVIDVLAPRLKPEGTSERLWSAVLPGIPESLEQLRASGLKLVVVSNADGTIERNIQNSGLREFFDAVVDSHVVGSEKPDPGIFLHALEAVQVSPTRTLHAGDIYAADVVGARAAGVHPVLLDPYEDWGELDCPKVLNVPDLTRRLLA